jgi:hypothetical protein
VEVNTCSGQCELLPGSFYPAAIWHFASGYRCRYSAGMEMGCSWIVVALAGVGAFALACLVTLAAIAIGLRCFGAGFFDKFLGSEPDRH